MSRHPYPNETFLIGENYFPINAGLIVESQDTYLHIYPNFPLGGGMPDQEHFELHLHRNPDKNDHLGINGYYGEYSPVEHEFLMGFTDLKPKKIWKKYLENKAAPQVFFKSLGNFLTEDFEAAEKTQSKWEYKSKYSLINEDKCGYVSSIMTRENDMICRVMNICDKPITPEFENFAVEEELNTLGGQIEQRQKAVANGILEFTINDNSAKNYVQYPTSDEDGLIQPFHLNTYKIKKISE